MTLLTWTDVQILRLRELDADRDALAARFADPVERNRSFQHLEKQLVSRERLRLKILLSKELRPRLLQLETDRKSVV